MSIVHINEHLLQNFQLKKKDSLSFVAFFKFVGEQAKFAESEERIRLGGFVVDLAARRRSQWLGRWLRRFAGRGSRLPLFTSAVDHFKDLRLRRIEQRLVEEPLDAIATDSIGHRMASASASGKVPVRSARRSRAGLRSTDAPSPYFVQFSVWMIQKSKLNRVKSVAANTRRQQNSRWP